MTSLRIGPETVRAWSVELDQLWAGARVRRIEGADSWVAMELHPIGWLICSWHPESCGCGRVDRETIDRLRLAGCRQPPILLALKSHLSGSHLVGAQQLNADRVLLMRFNRPVGLGIFRERDLILEASMRFSNLVLTDENLNVLETARTQKLSGDKVSRNRPGFPYLPPPLVVGLEPREWPEEMNPAGLPMLRGIGKGLIGILQSNWEKLDAPGELLKSLYSADAPPTAGIFLPQRSGGDFLVFPVGIPGAEKLEGTPLVAAGAWIAETLAERSFRPEERKAENPGGRKARQLKNRLEGLKIQLEECKQAELWKRRGEALLSWRGEIPDGATEAEVRFWGESGEETFRIPVNPHLSRIENARACFRHYHRGKAMKEQVELEIRRLEQEIRNFEQDEILSEALSIGLKKNRAGKPFSAEGRKAGKVAGVRRFEIGGFPVFVGTSAKGNREVTFRIASPEDLWFHAKGIPGAHVILKTGRRQVPQAVIEAAASIAAFFSKARTSSATVVEMTEKRHVRSAQGDSPGEVTVSRSTVLTVTAGLPGEVS